MDIVLAGLNINGQEVKVLMHAPKNGFFMLSTEKTVSLPRLKHSVSFLVPMLTDSETSKLRRMDKLF